MKCIFWNQNKYIHFYIDVQKKTEIVFVIKSTERVNFINISKQG